ncbi:MAG: hypothetical protein LBQ50_01205 [Planctomycetaceae bacterium]|jgi:hypothetical protein|nr:hypothetical protein [Planctomycetaceae bacterium]
MKRQFSFGTVFRMVDKSLLQSFFELIGVKVDGFLWEDVNRRHIEPLYKLFDALPPELRDRVEVALRDIHALACEKGMEELGKAAEELHAAEDSWKSIYVSDNNLYTKSLSAWLHHRDIFEHAIRYFEVDSLSKWRKRLDLPKITPTFDEEKRTELENELEQFFSAKQGRGFVCTVEMFSRPNGSFYFFAYPDDYVQDSYIHDENEILVSQTIRPTFEIVFAYNSIEGTSELYAKLPKKILEELEVIFLRILLDVIPEEEKESPYHLAMLLDPDFTLHTRPEDHINARVVSLALAWENDKEVIFVSRRSHSARELAMGSVKLTMALKYAAVKKAKFRFEFQNPVTGKYKTLTFEIGIPHFCTLKNQQPAFVEKAQFYLQQWGIEHGQNKTEPAGDALVPVTL